MAKIKSKQEIKYVKKRSNHIDYIQKKIFVQLIKRFNKNFNGFDNFLLDKSRLEVHITKLYLKVSLFLPYILAKQYLKLKQIIPKKQIVFNCQ